MKDRVTVVLATDLAYNFRLDMDNPNNPSSHPHNNRSTPQQHRVNIRELMLLPQMYQ
jgi:hypothetical protein